MADALFVGRGVFHLRFGREAPPLENRGNPRLGVAAGFLEPNNTIGILDVIHAAHQFAGHEVQHDPPRVGVYRQAF